MLQPFPPKTTACVAERAAAWSARRRTGDMGRIEQQEFAAWLADPAHRREFERIETLWGEMEPLRHQGLIAAELRQRRTRRRLSALPRYTAVSLLLASASWGLWGQLYPERSYQTVQAEFKTLTLADGSRIELDADTALTLRETPFSSEVSLAHGSALFSISHRPQRTFTVNAGAERIRDIGTRFGVSHEDDTTSVAVLEGEVELSNQLKPAEQAQRLTAGQGYRQQGLLGAHSALAADQFAWHEGRLMFDDTPLSEVLRQVNRYRHDPITLNDDKLAAMRLSGTFKLNDPNALLWALSRSLPLRVVNREGHTSLAAL